MLTSGAFWRDVGVGALSGALAGLVGFFAPQLLVAAGLNIQAGIAAAVFGGALTGAVVSGTAQVVTNVLTGQPWHTGLVGAVLTGAVIGGIAGGVGFKLRQLFDVSKLKNQLSSLLSKGGGAEGVTVIGKQGEYVELANKIGANVLDIPTEAWNRISNIGSRVGQWATNVQFLDDAVTRGDVFRLASSFKLGWAESNTFYKAELWHLLNKGYKLISAFGGEWLVPGT